MKKFTKRVFPLLVLATLATLVMAYDENGRIIED